jgi:hypothetical protein
MNRTIAIAAAAGLACGVLGQDVTLHFRAETPVVPAGGTVHWVVSASFTGYGPTAYFGGFVGDFPTPVPAVGEALNITPLMLGNATTPVANGASIGNLNMFHSALLGTWDPSNPINILEFDVLATAGEGTLFYGADGIISVFPDSGIFTLPIEFDAADHVDSDVVTIGTGGLGAPDVTVEIIPDRTQVYRGESVGWTVRAGFSGWDEPASFIGELDGDLIASDPGLGEAGRLVSLIGPDIAGTPSGASITGVQVAQPAGGPFDTSNPLDLMSFGVDTLRTGVLGYDVNGTLSVYPEPGGFEYPVWDLAVGGAPVTVLEPPAEVTLVCTADRQEISVGESVHWTISASFSGIDDPTGYFGSLVGDLVASEPGVGAVSALTNLLAAGGPGEPEGASVLGVDIRQDPSAGPVDTANPIDLLSFDVDSWTGGVLSYDASGLVRLFPHDSADGWLLDLVQVVSDSVQIHEPCNAADLALPYGTLDFSDINMFVDGFLDGCVAPYIELVPVSAYRSYEWEHCEDFPFVDCTSGSDSTTELGDWRHTTIGVYGAEGEMFANGSSGLDWQDWILTYTFAIDESTPVRAAAELRHCCYGILRYGLNRIEPSDEPIFDYHYLNPGSIPGGHLWIDQLHSLSPGTYTLSVVASANEGLAWIEFSFFVENQLCGPADLAEPIGVLDLADIVAFVEAFVAGCP